MSAEAQAAEDEPRIHQSNTGKLVYMANQIARFFVSQGDEEHAIAGTADHIRSFWTPVMLREIFAHLDTAGGEGLAPVSLGAIRRLRQVSPGAIRAELAEAGMPSGRDPGNDAG